MSVPDFGVTMAIFHGCCKLNFGLLRGHVKLCDFAAILLKGSTQRENILNFYLTLLDTDLDLLLPFKQNWSRLGPR